MDPQARRRWLQGLALGASAAALPVPAGARPGRKVLRLAQQAPETGFDPAQINSDYYSATLIAQMLEPPLGYDYLALPARLVPRTAVALPEASADHRVFTLRIRPGIFYSDDPAFGGRPRELVAADYVYAIKRFFDPQHKSGDLYQFEALKLPGMAALRERALRDKAPFDYDSQVEGLRTLDRYTLRFTLGAPDPRFPFMLATVYCSPIAREVVAHYGAAQMGAHPVGTGAFRLKRWLRGSRIELERSPGFRGEVYQGQPAAQPLQQALAADLAGQRLPRVDEVVVEVVEEEQPRWLGFLNGRYHQLQVPYGLVPSVAPRGELAPYLVQRGVQMQRQPLADMGMSYFTMTHPVVGGYTPEKVALRRAVALGFDQAGYIRHVLGGQAIIGQSLIGPFTSGYDPAYKSEMGDHDPARAKALLDAYGYVDRNGDGWREMPDGSPLVLEKASLSTQRDRLANEVWKRSMDRIGVRISFRISTWSELLKLTRSGTLMMWGFAWSASSPDGGFFLDTAYGPNAGESNDSRFALPAYDRLVERQKRLPDGPEREAVMREAKNLLAAYMPYKVHGHRIVTDVLKAGTRGYWRHPFMRDTWRYIDVPADDGPAA
ncbi:ABC transporter substrate-binding protein [Aquabacterium sp. OR-4]|uniref:ABC transporter substrate-binding protein n=1 Tax=Aquabacterium sp. OR-4 TaxID=2978127 RepID=UPI0028CB0E4A|nr:ABC transporter substrate-binding protein [Aquabacterium sp. OR-4]MDT7833783.1 ABC transporter substrate-binding protein [Aquabacterium sp. OR-4]